MTHSGHLLQYCITLVVRKFFLILEFPTCATCVQSYPFAASVASSSLYPPVKQLQPAISPPLCWRFLRLNRPTSPSLFSYVLCAGPRLSCWRPTGFAVVCQCLLPGIPKLGCAKDLVSRMPSGRSSTSPCKRLRKPQVAPNAPLLGTLGRGSYHSFIITFNQCKLVLPLKGVDCFILSYFTLGLILTQSCLAIHFISWPHKQLCWQKRMSRVDRSGKESSTIFFCSRAGLCQLTVTRLHSPKRQGELTKNNEEHGQEPL